MGAGDLVITFRPATPLAANDVITFTPLQADGTTTLGVGANSGVFASNAKLSTFLKATGTSGFNSKLKAKGGNLTNVTATVAKEPSAGTSVVVSGVANTAILSLTSMVALGFALLR